MFLHLEFNVDENEYRNENHAEFIEERYERRNQRNLDTKKNKNEPKASVAASFNLQLVALMYFRTKGTT